MGHDLPRVMSRFRGQGSNVREKREPAETTQIVTVPTRATTSSIGTSHPNRLHHACVSTDRTRSAAFQFGLRVKKRAHRLQRRSERCGALCGYCPGEHPSRGRTGRPFEEVTFERETVKIVMSLSALSRLCTADEKKWQSSHMAKIQGETRAWTCNFRMSAGYGKVPSTRHRFKNACARTCSL